MSSTESFSYEDATVVLTQVSALLSFVAKVKSPQPRVLVLKVWSPDQQHGVTWECIRTKILDPCFTPHN